MGEKGRWSVREKSASKMSCQITKMKFVSITMVRTPLTLVKEVWTVWTESFVVVPVSVPTLPWCDSATFTPDACHTHLHGHHHSSTTNHEQWIQPCPNLTYISLCFHWNLPRPSSSCYIWDNWVQDRQHDNSSGNAHTPTKAKGEMKHVAFDSKESPLRSVIE